MICQKREPRPSAGRGLGNPHVQRGDMIVGGLRKETHGRARGSPGVATTVTSAAARELPWRYAAFSN